MFHRAPLLRIEGFEVAGCRLHTGSPFVVGGKTVDDSRCYRNISVVGPWMPPKLEQSCRRTPSRVCASPAAQPADKVVHEGGRPVLHRRWIDLARRLAPRALNLQPGEAAIDRLVDCWGRVDWFTVGPDAARSSSRTATGRLAGSSLRPGPASRRIEWTDRMFVMARALPSSWSAPYGHRRTAAWGGTSAPSGTPPIGAGLFAIVNYLFLHSPASFQTRPVYA
jgi:hypothetical protein